MKHIVITRCKFIDNLLFEKYFEVMRKMYIPALRSQTIKNFDLHIITHKTENMHHRDLISKEFEGSGINLLFDIPKIKPYLVKQKYNIQTRHDCDDWMAPTYIEKIQQVYSENMDKHDEFMIQAQPLKYDIETGKDYICKVFTKTRTSMFLSLCQKTPSKHIFLKKHMDFPEIVPMVFNLGDGLVKLVIHKNNRLSKIFKNDKAIN